MIRCIRSTETGWHSCSKSGLVSSSRSTCHPSPKRGKKSQSG